MSSNKPMYTELSVLTIPIFNVAIKASGFNRKKAFTKLLIDDNFYKKIT